MTRRARRVLTFRNQRTIQILIGGKPSPDLMRRVIQDVDASIAAKVPRGRWLDGADYKARYDVVHDSYDVEGRVQYLENRREAIRRIIRALLDRFKRSAD